MKILINGGGIAGLTCAIALQKLRIETVVFESAPEIKPVGAGLVIQSNAIKALEYLGIEDKIIDAANPINQIAIIDEKANVIKKQKPSSINRELFAGLAIHRHTLHQILKSYLPENLLFTSKKAISFLNKDGKVILQFKDGSNAEGDFLICDIKPLNQFAFNKVLLIGDAAHATTPNLGQGACQAIEDVMVLHQEIASGKDVESAFKSFEKRRTEKARYIINTSRKLGSIAQIENKFLISLRNIVFKLTPDFVTEHQFKKIYN
jgi:2-polyprenyl-6-methoxyphenol hydroxylase-like FAD-dependent oxidoreductase